MKFGVTFGGHLLHYLPRTMFPSFRAVHELVEGAAYYGRIKPWLLATEVDAGLQS